MCTEAHPDRTSSRASWPAHTLADQAFSRAAGAPLISGNTVRILKDGKENYSAWLEAIGAAKRTIHFESYIIHGDDIGRRFAAALAERARAGVQVRLLYDWFGGLRFSSRGLWPSLREAGVEVRCFNPLRFDRPFGWLSRDHRKLLTVDGCLGFVSGLCVGRSWVGYPERGIEPWRDTGVVIQGPAVADIELAFSETWGMVGPPILSSELRARESIPPAGDVTLRVVASMPNTADLYRLDQLIAVGARRSLWLTDAYFVGTTLYVQALRSASKDGVDVRLLVPGVSDVPFIRSLSRSGYRPLLEGGIRVFEWNGSMLHAKTAVADSRWARVGSTNLNLASWIGNCELDVAVENEPFAQAMEQMYLEDLAHTTEIVLSVKRRILPTERPQPSRRLRIKGSAGRAAAGAIGITQTVGAAITNRRALGPAEARVMAGAGLLLVGLAVITVLWPKTITVPLAVVLAWVAVSLFVRAHRLHVKGYESQGALESKLRPPNVGSLR